jgi:hypothetical protein
MWGWGGEAVMLPKTKTPNHFLCTIKIHKDRKLQDREKKITTHKHPPCQEIGEILGFIGRLFLVFFFIKSRSGSRERARETEMSSFSSCGPS